MHNAVLNTTVIFRHEFFAERRFFEELRLEPYYAYHRDVKYRPAAHDFLETADRRGRENGQIALVHGDYSPKNVLLHEDRLVLLDYEVIHFGDPAFDIGFSLAHLLRQRRCTCRAIGQICLTMAREYWHCLCGFRLSSAAV